MFFPFTNYKTVIINEPNSSHTGDSIYLSTSKSFVVFQSTSSVVNFCKIFADTSDAPIVWIDDNLTSQSFPTVIDSGVLLRVTIGVGSNVTGTLYVFELPE